MNLGTDPGFDYHVGCHLWSVLLDENIGFESIYNCCIKVDKKLIKEVSLFDVYQGDKLPPNKKNRKRIRRNILPKLFAKKIREEIHKRILIAK